MTALIPLSEKKEEKKRRVTISAEVFLKPKEFELLMLLAGNNLIRYSEIIDKIFDGKNTPNNREKMYQLIGKLKGYGFNITTRQLIGYKCDDEIFIK